MIFDIFINELDGVLFSLEISVKLQSQNMTISNFGSTFFFVSNLFLNFWLKIRKEARRHLEVDLLHAHDSWDEVLIAFLVEKL